MHAEDEHDNTLVTEEMALNVHTRAQMRAAEAAKAAKIAIAADRQAVLPAITEDAEILVDNDDGIDDTFPEKLVSDSMLVLNIPSSTTPRRQLAKARAFVDVDIHDDFANHSEIAKLRVHY